MNKVNKTTGDQTLPLILCGWAALAIGMLLGGGGAICAVIGVYDFFASPVVSHATAILYTVGSVVVSVGGFKLLGWARI